jgi:putative heme-binding domain-containing protein
MKFYTPISRSTLSIGLHAFVAALVFVTSTHAQRNLKNIPDPAADKERASFIVPDGFEVNLYAADPQIAKPIQMNFDAQGRLWIASSELYPQIKPGQKADDKILILEDKDRDGTAESTTVFASGLLIPTGVLPGDGGVYVANSTELIHLSDGDGDGQAETRRVMLSGFGTEDTHHLLHTLRWGHDGAIYMNQSIYIHSHLETPYGVKRLNGGGIWRFRPDNRKLDIVCRGFVNPWGHHFDYWGQSFATDGAYGEGINYVFPGAVYVTAPGAKRRLKGLNPGSPKHCGLEILSGRHLPEEWRGNMLTNDFRAHRVCRFVVSEDGSGFASRQETEVIKTSHGAFRPIDVKMGPDGAIYVADWYNPIIQHGEVDFRDPRRDHTHGRIWRITAKDRPLVERPDLQKLTNLSLLSWMKAPEEWLRLHAKLTLKSRGAKRVLPDLQKWIASLDSADELYEHHLLEALWLYQCFDEVDQGLADKLFASKDHRVRAAVLRVVSLWRDRLDDPAKYMKLAVNDEHPRVRLEGVRALSERMEEDSAAHALAVLHKPMDRFLDFALWQAMRDLESQWVPLVKSGQLNKVGDLQQLTFAVRSVDSVDVVNPLLELVRKGEAKGENAVSLLQLIVSLSNPQQLTQVWRILTDGELDETQQLFVLNAMVASTLQRRIKPAGELKISPWFEKASLETQKTLIRAAGQWHVAPLWPQIKDLAEDNTNEESPLRGDAIAALAAFGGDINLGIIAQLSRAPNHLSARIAAVNVLSTGRPELAANGAVELAGVVETEEQMQSLLGGLLGQKNGPAALRKALNEKTLKADVAKTWIRLARRASQNQDALLLAIRTAGNLDNSGWKLTPELVEALVAEVATKGDAHRGEMIYRRSELQCMKCHRIAGAGGSVGPDLVSVGASAPIDYLIDSLIDPAKKVKENFHSLSVITDRGKVVTGIPVRQSATEIVLKNAEDVEVTIPTAQVDEKQEARSLMPDGLVNSLTRRELVDLVAFMSKLGKVGDFAVGKERVVRRWESLLWTKEANHRLNRTSFDTVATDDAALTWVSQYSTVAGELPIETLPKFSNFRAIPPTSFLRFEIEVTTAGQATIDFGSSEGLTMWFDGKPTKLTSQLTTKFEKGRHHITLAINSQLRTEPLRVEVLDVTGEPTQLQIIQGK